MVVLVVHHMVCIIVFTVIVCEFICFILFVIILIVKLQNMKCRTRCAVVFSEEL